MKALKDMTAALVILFVLALATVPTVGKSPAIDLGTLGGDD